MQQRRLELFKRLANMPKEHLPGVVHAMLNSCGNANVEAMNGLLQPTQGAARGFRAVAKLIAIAYLCMTKLQHLPSNALRAPLPCVFGVTQHAARSKIPSETAWNLLL